MRMSNKQQWHRRIHSGRFGFIKKSSSAQAAALPVSHLAIKGMAYDVYSMGISAPIARAHGHSHQPIRSGQGVAAVAGCSMGLWPIAWAYGLYICGDGLQHGPMAWGVWPRWHGVYAARVTEPCPLRTSGMKTTWALRGMTMRTSTAGHRRLMGKPIKSNRCPMPPIDGTEHSSNRLLLASSK